MNNAILMWTDDWEALYINGSKVFEDHSIGNIEMLKLAEEHNFSYSTFRDCEISGGDLDDCLVCGNMPDTIEELKEKYN